MSGVTSHFTNQGSKLVLKPTHELEKSLAQSVKQGKKELGHSSGIGSEVMDSVAKLTGTTRLEHNVNSPFTKEKSGTFSAFSTSSTESE